MSNMERVGLEGVFDLSQFSGNLNVYLNAVGKVKGETASAAASVSKSGQGIDVFGQIATGALRSVGEQAVLWMGRAAKAVEGFVVDSFKGALLDEQTLQRLNLTIKATGAVAGLTSAESQALAQSFHVLAGGSDDVVLSLTNVGLQMGTISEEEMPAFIQASLDLGAVMGSATEAARLLAFAQEQPTAALKRLRQANVIFTDSQTAQIKAMEEAGNTAGAFAIIMDRVTAVTAGAAQSALGTLNGKVGLFGTTIGEAGEKIFGALLPAVHELFDNTLGRATPIIDTLSTSLSDFFTSVLAGEGVAGFEALRQAVDDNLGQTAANALDWGKNITLQLAQGIIDGISFVMEALSSVASVITSWLMPGSPPRLLPDLDKWGAEAFGVYMQGWTKGDFSAFNDISRTIESFLKSGIDSSDKGAQSNLIATLLGSRAAITQAINDVREFGSVSQASLRQIFDAVSVSSPELEAYIATMLNLEGINQQVAEAQGELTEAQRAYDEAVKASQKTVDSITDAQQDFSDQVAISQLKLIENDPNATAIEKQRARLKIQELIARKEQRDTLNTKQIAVDAAQEKFDAVKAEQQQLLAQADAQKAILDVMQEQNRLLMERASIGQGGGGGGGATAPKGGGLRGGGWLPGGEEDDNKMKKRVEDPFKKISAAFKKQLSEFFEPVTDQFEKLQTAWEPIFTKIGEIWNRTVVPALKAFSGWVTEHSPEITAFFTGFAGTLAAVGAAAGVFVVAVTVMATVLGALSSPLVLIGIAVGLLAAAWVGNWGGIRDTLTEIWNGTILPAFETIKTWLETNIPLAIETLSAFWKETLLPALKTVWEWMDGTLFPFFEELVNFFDAGFTLALTALTGLWEKTLLPAIKSVWEMLDEHVFPIFKNIGDYLDETFGPAIKTVKDIISNFVNIELTNLSNIWTGINQGIQDATKWLGDMAEKLSSIVLPDWLTPGSPTPFEMGLRGISAAMAELSGANIPGLATSLTSRRMQAASNLLAPMAPVHSSTTINSPMQKYYNLAVNTRDTVQTVEHNFYHMQAKYGGA